MFDADPLYRPRMTLSGDDVQVLGGVHGAVVVIDTDPDAAEAQYLPDRDVSLAVTDDIEPSQLRAALPAFLEHASALADRPTKAFITLPSRDVDRCRVAREAGLTPYSTLAVADLRRLDQASASMVVRDASAEDADDVTALYVEQAEYEARVGPLRISASIRAAIAREVPSIISGAGQTLVAEHDGRVVATVLAQSVADSAWVAQRIAADPVSYLAVGSTASAYRGRGAGAALIAELHRRHRADGIAISALHYSAYNPLSIPFWSQRGYRPLLSTFAATIRS